MVHVEHIRSPSNIEDFFFGHSASHIARLVELFSASIIAACLSEIHVYFDMQSKLEHAGRYCTPGSSGYATTQRRNDAVG